MEIKNLYRHQRAIKFFSQFLSPTFSQIAFLSIITFFKEIPVIFFHMFFKEKTLKKCYWSFFKVMIFTKKN